MDSRARVNCWDESNPLEEPEKKLDYGSIPHSELDSPNTIKIINKENGHQNPDIALAIVCFAFFVDFLLQCMIIPLLPQFIMEFNFDPSWVGVVVATKPLVEFLTAPFFGWLSDTRGRRLTMVLGLLSLGASTIMFGLSSSLHWLIVSRVMQGVASQATLNSGYALVCDLYPDNIRGQKSAYLQIAICAGFCLGAPLGAALFLMGGLKFPFFVFGGLVVVSGLLRWLLVDPPRTVKVASENESWMVISDPIVWQCALILFLSNTMSGMNQVMYPLYLALDLHMSIGLLGVIMFCMTLGFLISVAIVSRIGDKFGGWWQFCCVGLILMGLVAQAYFYENKALNFATAGILLSVFDGFVDASWNPALATHVNARVGTDASGRAFALATMGRSAAHVAGPLVGAALPPHLGFGLTFSDAGKILIVCGVPLLLIHICRDLCCKKPAIDRKFDSSHNA